MVHSSVTDWQPYISHQVLDKYKNLQILEFGLGVGTECFLDKGHTVHSVEILSSIQNTSWFDNMKQKYQNRAWRGSFVQISGEIDNIEINERVKGYYDIQKSPMIQETLRGIITPYFQEQTYDFIFVDPGIHLRPEIVNLAFETQTKFIATHDTSVGHNHYGWEYLNHPPIYQRLCDSNGMGTTLFVLNKSF
jgi:hypothetical protein